MSKIEPMLPRQIGQPVRGEHAAHQPTQRGAACFVTPSTGSIRYGRVERWKTRKPSTLRRFSRRPWRCCVIGSQGLANERLGATATARGKGPEMRSLLKTPGDWTCVAAKSFRALAAPSFPTGKSFRRAGFSPTGARVWTNGVQFRHSSRNTGTGSARPFSRRSPSDANRTASVPQSSRTNPEAITSPAPASLQSR